VKLQKAAASQENNLGQKELDILNYLTQSQGCVIEIIHLEVERCYFSEEMSGKSCQLLLYPTTRQANQLIILLLVWLAVTGVHSVGVGSVSCCSTPLHASFCRKICLFDC
jgi:hypothetical protein